MKIFILIRKVEKDLHKLRNFWCSGEHLNKSLKRITPLCISEINENLEDEIGYIKFSLSLKASIDFIDI